MKQIENKQIQILNQTQQYKDLIMSCITITPKEGFNYQLNKKIERVEKVLEGNKPKFDIEDADFEFLKSKVMEMSWAIYDRQLTAFQDYINSL